jgi:hypothetical protein
MRENILCTIFTISKRIEQKNIYGSNFSTAFYKSRQKILISVSDRNPTVCSCCQCCNMAKCAAISFPALCQRFNSTVKNWDTRYHPPPDLLKTYLFNDIFDCFEKFPSTSVFPLLARKRICFQVNFWSNLMVKIFSNFNFNFIFYKKNGIIIEI